MYFEVFYYVAASVAFLITYHYLVRTVLQDEDLVIGIAAIIGLSALLFGVTWPFWVVVLCPIYLRKPYHDLCEKVDSWAGSVVLMKRDIK